MRPVLTSAGGGGHLLQALAIPWVCRKTQASSGILYYVMGCDVLRYVFLILYWLCSRCPPTGGLGRKAIGLVAVRPQSGQREAVGRRWGVDWDEVPHLSRWTSGFVL